MVSSQRLVSLYPPGGSVTPEADAALEVLLPMPRIEPATEEPGLEGFSYGVMLKVARFDEENDVS